MTLDSTGSTSAAPASPRRWNYLSVSGLFIVFYHLALLVGLPFYFYHQSPSWGLVLTSIVLLFTSEIGIGAAYHRFYSHRAYSMNRSAEMVLLFLGTLCLQGSVLRWSFEHRLHHAYTDTHDDPYTIKRGFWYAHFLWLFTESRPIEKKRVRDLLNNPLVRFQHRFYAPLAFGSNILVWLLVGFAFKDYLGAFVLAWWLRLFVSHHLTWFVNSLAHLWGARTYMKELTAVDNYVLAFLTVGEGYHNYHHTFAADYRNGVRWYHFDPVKWTVWSLSKLGLARDLRRVSAPQIHGRLIQEDRKLLEDRLRRHDEAEQHDWRRRIEALSGRIREKLGRQRALLERVREYRDKQLASERMVRVKEMRRELRTIRRGLRRDLRAWSRLCTRVLEAPV